MAKNKVVLAIDDISLNLAIIRGILSPSYDVRVAKSGELAIYILGSVEVDLILLDIEMPGMSGFDFMDVIAEIPGAADIPVIIVTSHATSQFVSKAMRSGAKDYIIKPINTQLLKEKVAKVLAESGS